MSSKDSMSPNGTTSFSCIHPYLVIAYLTECTLATIALLLNRRGTTAGELNRHIDIAQYGVDYLRSVGIDTASIRHLPRLCHLLDCETKPSGETKSSDENNSVNNWVKSLKTVLPK